MAQPALDRSRFAALSPPDGALARPIAVVGCGGLGSFTAEALVRMGCRSFVLIDPDKVEPANVATQNFTRAAIGKFKVAALRTRLRAIAPQAKVVLAPDRATYLHMKRVVGHVVISAVDSIEVRRQIYDAIVQASDAIAGEPTLLVDPRMGLESLEVYAAMIPASTDQDKAYQVALFDTTQRYAEDPCGAKAIAYTGAFVAGVVPSLVRRYLKGISIPYMTIGDVGAQRLQSYWAPGSRYTEEVDAYGVAIDEHASVLEGGTL